MAYDEGQKDRAREVLGKGLKKERVGVAGWARLL
jgi:hypothetical protein